MKSRPRMLMCPLCGREYGSKSLPIHYPQCTKKWLEQEALKPAHERRPLPVMPEAIQDALDGKRVVPMTGAQVQAFNNQAVSKYETESLNHCSICGRSFNDKAWIKHQTLCTPYNPFKPAGTSLGKESRSVKMAPGKISGTHHKQAVLPGRRSADELISAPGSSPYLSPSGGSIDSPAATLKKTAPAALASSTSPIPQATLKSKSPTPASNTPSLPHKQTAQLPELPPSVVDLAKKVCLEPAGELATTALLTHLKEQRVTSMEDLKFMQLDWLVSALQPAGLSPLLLNKFLTLAKDGQSP